MKKLTILFFVFAFALAACGTSATATPGIVDATPAPANAVIAEGRVVPAQDAALAFQARGTVTEVAVEIGDTVKAGDVLARLGGPSDAAYAAAQVELVNAQQAYDDFIRNTPLYAAQAWQAYMDAMVKRAAAARRWEGVNLDNIETRIEDAEEEIQDRLEDLEEAQARWEKYKDLPEGDWLRQDAENKLEEAQEKYNEALRKLEAIQRERDSARAAYDLALANEAEAKRKYENALNGPDKEKLAALEARLNAAKANVAAFAITAPFDGTIMDVNLAPGDQAGPETWAVKIADTRVWYVETSDLTELEVVKVAVGQKVTLVPDALPDLTMTGAVESISQAFTIQGGDVQYRVKIKVDEVDPRVLWGMTVEIIFEPLR
ncbi:MAG: efflux RND transporter periplasmic adaptor subunit [Chloroflexota bacterium]